MQSDDMQKKLLALGAALGTMVLLGAGCAEFNGPTLENTNKTDEKTTETSTTEQTTTTETTETATEFFMTASATGPHTVVVEWTVPANFSRGSIFRVLNSAFPKPSAPTAWFDQFTNPTRSATLTDVKSGKRYFRVCEYRAGDCVSYSNEVEVDVE